MRRFLYVVAIAAGMAVMIPADARTDNPMAGKPFRFRLPDLDGNVVTQDDERFRHKVVLVDIFGTWCPPCRRSLPTVKELHKSYNTRGLEVVGIAFERGDPSLMLTQLERYIRQNGIAYPVLFGGTTSDVRKHRILPSLKNFDAFPTFIVIGRDGTVYHSFSGFTEDKWLTAPDGSEEPEKADVASPGRLEAAIKELLYKAYDQTES